MCQKYILYHGKTENAHDTPAARPLCMHACEEMEHCTEHIPFNNFFVKQYGSDELVLCQCLYMLSCRNAGEGDYCTSDPIPWPCSLIRTKDYLIVIYILL